MRPAQLASLLALLLIVSGIHAGPRKGGEEFGPPILRRPKADPVVLATWQTEGGGETREEAEEDALKKARVLVTQYFAEQHAPISWTLDLQYVRTRLMKSSEDAEPQRLPDGLGLWRKVKVQVVLNSDDR